MFKLNRLLTGIAISTIAFSSVAAQEIKIGLSAEPTSIDPHYHYFTPNLSLHAHTYEPLTVMDAQQRIQPGLAVSWKALDATTWEFKLREGVKFSDGNPFTARDVIFTICRVPNVANSPGAYTISTRSIASMQVADANTLIIKTERPNPLLPIELSTVGVISATASGAPATIAFDRQGCGLSAWPKTEDFNSLKISVGTGPYRVVEYTRGERVVLERNETYWGGKPHWARAILRPITSAAPRVAALLAGDVDLIENPPVRDLDRIKNATGLAVSQAASSRVIYLGINAVKDSAPSIEGMADKNPLKDRRVREAMLLAIDRKGIAERIMGGLAVPAVEPLPSNMFGATPNANVPEPNIAKARDLLSSAGYPTGFKLTLGSPAERYPNDTQVAQAIASLLTRIGIQTSVEALPAAQFFPKANRGDYSVWLTGWLSDTGEMSNPLRSFIATRNADKGFGQFNGGYSSAEVDQLLEKAVATVDDNERRTLLNKAVKIAMDDVAVIPLYFQVSVWGHKKDLRFTGRANERTMVTDIAPAN